MIVSKCLKVSGKYGFFFNACGCKCGEGQERRIEQQDLGRRFAVCVCVYTHLWGWDLIYSVFLGLILNSLQCFVLLNLVWGSITQDCRETSSALLSLWLFLFLSFSLSLSASLFLCLSLCLYLSFRLPVSVSVSLLCVHEHLPEMDSIHRHFLTYVLWHLEGSVSKDSSDITYQL